LLKGSKISPIPRRLRQGAGSLLAPLRPAGARRRAVAVTHAREVVETEINSATDNPWCSKTATSSAAGNFHGEPSRSSSTTSAIATAEVASIAERRIYMLLHGDTIGDLKVPRMLMKDTGLNSGFMIPQYTAAALVSGETRSSRIPPRLIPSPRHSARKTTSPMGSISATKLLEVVKNTETVPRHRVHVLGAGPGIVLRPLKSGRGVGRLCRGAPYIPFAQADRLFHHDVQTALALVRSEQIAAATQAGSGKTSLTLEGRAPARPNIKRGLAELGPPNQSSPQCPHPQSAIRNPRTPPSAPRAATSALPHLGRRAAMRMLMNNLDPEVAERPADLVAWRPRQGGAQLARPSTPPPLRSKNSRPTTCWSSPVKPVASSAHTPTPRACAARQQQSRAQVGA